MTSLLIRLEELLNARGTGAFMVGSRSTPRAIVLIEAGKVCWAVAQNMRRRLTTLLSMTGALAVQGRQLQELYLDCRKTGNPIGEELVARGLVTSHQLRRALLQHTTEALCLAASDEFEVEWVPHKRQRYNAMYTFEPADLWVMYGALLAPELARAANRQLKRSLKNGGMGWAFFDCAGTFLAIAAEGAPLGGICSLIQHAGWASETLGLVQQALGVRFLACRSAQGEAALGAATWKDGELAYYVQYDDPSTFAYLFSQHCRDNNALVSGI